MTQRATPVPSSLTTACIAMSRAEDITTHHAAASQERPSYSAANLYQASTKAAQDGSAAKASHASSDKARTKASDQLRSNGLHGSFSSTNVRARNNAVNLAKKAEGHPGQYREQQLAAHDHEDEPRRGMEPYNKTGHYLFPDQELRYLGEVPKPNTMWEVGWYGRWLTASIASGRDST